MLKPLIVIAAIAIAVGIWFQTANAHNHFTPDAMYHAKVHQHLHKAGVSFVHFQFDDHIIVLQRAGEPTLVAGYDTAQGVCSNLKKIRTVKKITVHGVTTTSVAPCK